MFYSHSILAKSGPFAHVWLAATWEKKVTRSMIFGTDIATVVESIANPAAPLALRLSANLLVGVVRIYARKARAGVRRGRLRGLHAGREVQGQAAVPRRAGRAKIDVFLILIYFGSPPPPTHDHGASGRSSGSALLSAAACSSMR